MEEDGKLDAEMCTSMMSEQAGPDVAKNLVEMCKDKGRIVHKRWNFCLVIKFNKKYKKKKKKLDEIFKLVKVNDMFFFALQHLSLKDKVLVKKILFN